MIAFVDWAMREFDGATFGVCGKTVKSAIKNIVRPYMSLSYAKERYAMNLKGSDNVLTVSGNGHINYFEIFGGRDESSQDLIQGRTLAGVLLDEVVLMPRSFVEQAVSRCLTIKNRRYFFMCNPGQPSHWFNVEYVQQLERRNALRLHFELKDNPIFGPDELKEIEAQYTGVFYDRYILGKWTQAEGLIYQDYEKAIEPKYEGAVVDYCISCDYGTQNAFAALLWAKDPRGTWHAIDEYYYSGRDEGHQKTDADYLEDMLEWAQDLPERVEFIIDPSAASMIAALRRSGRFKVRKARNDVLAGIKETAICIQRGTIKIADSCENWAKEAAGYVWDSKAADDRPVKVADHAQDACRYFVATKKLAKNREEAYQSIFERGAQ
jgi:PBSX family phage terminase large subunit